MKFNRYIWDLYKNSDEGKNVIEKWDPNNTFPIEKYYRESDKSFVDKLIRNGLEKYARGNKVDIFHLNVDFFKQEIKNSKITHKELFKSLLGKGIQIKDLKLVRPENYEFWVTSIRQMSETLYTAHPEYFFNYLYDCEFDKFKQICDVFEIPLPEVPKKRDWEKRALYYTNICDALFEFRQLNGFSPQELHAFIYGFAPNVIKELEDKELPPPTKVWFAGAHKGNFEQLDNANDETTFRWQGNIDTRRGDIIVIYCLTPRSHIQSIWRAKGNGFADPFFYWYNVVEISNPILLEATINQKDLESNTLWSKNPLVRKNLQGINGYPIKYEEYLELLSILETKGQNIKILPTIKPTSKFETNDLTYERDIEVKLIEPLLHTLKYKSSDWIRQMPIKMGRGERNYPDYCFGANPKRGEESAEMVLESKYEIRTNKDLQEAFFQARSYALRLQAKCFIIAAKEGIWIFTPVEGVYKLEETIHYNWIQIENPDIVHDLQIMIGKK